MADGWKSKGPSAGVDGVDAYGSRKALVKRSSSRWSFECRKVISVADADTAVSDIEVAPFLETRNEIQSLTTTDLHTFPGSEAPATVNA